MSDPVSWLLIEPGWTVEAADGAQVGRIEEVTGDSDKDIFDGLSISSGMFSTPRYVPAEQVGEIVDGRVRLKIDRAAVERLGTFDEPAEQEQIEPEKASHAARAETWAADPTGHAGRVGLVRRTLEWLGLAGRR
jgi:hypothetical protein